MRRAIVLGFAVVVLGVLAGCSSKYMKGTPLYTGEYPKREGPAEDRVNLWPLAYYRKPALSILWPLMEATDDHLAARPFFSVYKLDKPRHEYNVLAPLAQFDYDAQQHHVLPVDWGVGSDQKPYFNVLPLLWSGRDAQDLPYFSVFPAVWTGHTSGGKPYYVLFPLVWWYPQVQGVFPVFWSATSFAVAPLVWYRKGEHFYAFPLWLHTRHKDGYDTHLLWPIGRRMRTAEKDGFDVWPLVGAYRSLEGGTRWYRAYALGPLAGYERAEDCMNRWVTPLYFEGRNKGSSALGVFPLFYRDEEAGYRRTFTPLWSFGGDPKSRWDFVTPFYYRAKSQDESLTLSPVWLSGSAKDSHWETLPLLYYHRETPKESLTLSPVWSSGKLGDTAWSAALPFYYERHNAATKARNVLTPVVGWERTPERTRTTLFPLLSSLTWRGEEKDFWFLAPLSRFRWGGGRAQSHIFPLYYSDSQERLFVSPLLSRRDTPEEGFVNVLGLLAQYTRFRDGWRSLTLPFALSHLAWLKKEKKLDILLGLLAHAEWGGKKLRHHVFPLYAYDREERTFLSPLVSWKNKPESRFFNVLGLLFHYEREGGSRSLRLLAPLTYFGWGKGSSQAMVIPLFSWSWKRTHEQAEAPDFKETLVVLPWLWFERSVVSDFGKDGAARATRTGEQRASQLFPFWHSSGSKDLATGRQQADFNILGVLYDYQYRGRVEWSKDPKDVSDYTRARILWRVMHYERAGGDSTLDVFPFITSDRRADGSRQFTFFWRFYRNQRTADGGRKLDVFFIPILRHRGAAPAQAMR